MPRFLATASASVLEAEHRPREAVLLEVVAQAQHKGLEHLTLFAE
jgi:hypothetical protein